MVKINELVEGEEEPVEVLALTLPDHSATHTSVDILLPYESNIAMVWLTDDIVWEKVTVRIAFPQTSTLFLSSMVEPGAFSSYVERFYSSTVGRPLMSAEHLECTNLCPQIELAPIEVDYGSLCIVQSTSDENRLLRVPPVTETDCDEGWWKVKETFSQRQLPVLTSEEASNSLCWWSGRGSYGEAQLAILPTENESISLVNGVITECQSTTAPSTTGQSVDILAYNVDDRESVPSKESYSSVKAHEKKKLFSLRSLNCFRRKKIKSADATTTHTGKQGNAVSIRSQSTTVPSTTNQYGDILPYKTNSGESVPSRKLNLSINSFEETKVISRGPNNFYRKKKDLAEDTNMASDEQDLDPSSTEEMHGNFKVTPCSQSMKLMAVSFSEVTATSSNARPNSPVGTRYRCCSIEATVTKLGNSIQDAKEKEKENLEVKAQLLQVLRVGSSMTNYCPTPSICNSGVNTTEDTSGSDCGQDPDNFDDPRHTAVTPRLCSADAEMKYTVPDCAPSYVYSAEPTPTELRDAVYRKKDGFVPSTLVSVVPESQDDHFRREMSMDSDNSVATPEVTNDAFKGVETSDTYTLQEEVTAQPEESAAKNRYSFQAMNILRLKKKKSSNVKDGSKKTVNDQEQKKRANIVMRGIRGMVGACCTCWRGQRPLPNQ